MPWSNASGYNQDDVVSLAKAITGWTIYSTDHAVIARELICGPPLRPAKFR